MKITVTGTVGFVGERFARPLLERQVWVITVENGEVTLTAESK